MNKIFLNNTKQTILSPMQKIKYHISNYENILPYTNILLNNFEIKYFHFVRIYNDETRISLTDYKEWMEFYYENKFYITPTFIKSFQLAQDKHCLWVALPDDKILPILREKFGIGNGITVIEKNKDYCEYFYFEPIKITIIYIIFI